jgi:serine/threonine protein kinase
MPVPDDTPHESTPDPNGTGAWDGVTRPRDGGPRFDYSSPSEAAGAPASASDPSFLQAEPAAIPGFRLLREIGHGGFGRVYEAVSTGDVAQRVAVKVLFRATPPAARAFEAEKKILANLSHPNIARYIASGVLEDGRPWMALEFVEGLQLDKYCEREQLSTAERLALFTKICAGVQHAHEFGIWHLDLKPQNILVTLEGEPKLLDFGIAKISRSIDATTLLSQTRGFFTYLYSSPEQLRGEPLSSRSDVYNLGLILYELLTGTRVRNPKIQEIEEFVRAALQSDPEPPSARVAKSREKTGGPFDANISGTTTSQGGSNRLARRLRGDLDNIVLMALRREPTKRYESPSALAADIARHIDNLPVEARRASFGYRFARHLQRQRVSIGVVALALVATAATGFALWAKAEADKSEVILAAQEASAAELAAKYRTLSSGLGWLELDFSREGGDPMAVIGAQRDLEKAQLALMQARGKPSPVAVGSYVRTLLRFAAVCKREKEIEKGLAAMAESEALLAGLNATDWTATEIREMTARVLEVKADLLLKGGRDLEAHPLHERAFAIREEVVKETSSAPDAIYSLSKVRQRVYDAQMFRSEFATAVATADAMIAERERILAHEMGGSDARRKDRYERDVMLGRHWRLLAKLELGDIDGADADAAAMLATARKRAAVEKPERDAEWDVALALQDSAAALSARARFVEADGLLKSALEAIDTAIARNNGSQATLESGFEIAGDHLDALLGAGKPADALASAQAFEERLALIARGLKDDRLESMATRAGLPAVRFQLLRLAALLASDDVVALRERALALRAGLPQGIEPSRGLPLWLIEAATLRLRASEGDTASARESAERALALAARANDSRQLAACAIVVQRLCGQAQIAATGLAGYPDALAAVQGIKGAALREHFARQFVQVDAERN